MAINATVCNATPCPSHSSVFLFATSDISRFVVECLVLGAINLLIVGSNLLVLVSIHLHRQLHTQANVIIASLAVADLLLGITVLPFSVAQQVTQRWLFSNSWCHLWLALDVWLCTASIYNLVAISIDRLYAVTKPLHYRAGFGRKLCRIILPAAWVWSLLISCPPLFLWLQTDDRPAWKCIPTNHHPYYVLFSSLTSFFIPLFMLVTMNIVLYCRVRRSIAVVALGLQQTAGALGLSRHTRQSLMMRVHRKRSKQEADRKRSKIVAGFHEAARRAISITAQRPHFVNGTSTETSDKTDKELLGLSEPTREKHEAIIDDTAICEDNGSNHVQDEKCDNIVTDIDTTQISCENVEFPKRSLAKSHSQLPTKETTPRKTQSGAMVKELVTAKSDSSIMVKLRRMSEHYSARTLHHADKMRRITTSAEFRAARAVCVVVGCFIICWLPFSVAYFVSAYLGIAIQETLFDCLFWLGYCNSFLNPLIYAVYSKDFRRAFAKILCPCIKSDHIMLDLRGSLRGKKSSQRGDSQTSTRQLTAIEKRRIYREMGGVPASGMARLSQWNASVVVQHS